MAVSGSQRHILASAVCALLAFPAAVQAQGSAPAEVPLAPHLAVYDLKLSQSRGKQSVESVRGRILYDFGGSTCDGYTLSFRQVTELDSGEGKKTVSDLRTTNWEDGAGNSFRFRTQNFLDGDMQEASEGNAERQDGKVTVRLVKPEPKQVDAGVVLFPTDHIRQVIRAAMTGKPLFEVGIYDGSENGERLYNSLTVIGPAIAAGERVPNDAAAKHTALSAQRRWPVNISYFDRAKAGGDQTPAYSIAFELYENGIARAIKLDYGDFVIDGDLTTLEIRDLKPCP